ncbi:phage head morphogenesis protein [Methylophilus aquaticus]|uniref:Phage minor head protein n=1 Tax=Methylophilus aquaticus TaxID=1971610 RepID=A0ABT9JTJ1_9PROT|nr:phage minor head protein [Methylophilus aquaticus]MDP8567912.1 phage minor head protein [Methylophilus aquaticus]
MQLNESDIKLMFGMKPADAIAYLEKKGMRLSWDWHETLDSVNARSFTVAKAARIDILQSLKSELKNQLVNGGTQKQFIDNLTPILQQQGWWGKQVIVDPAGNAQMVQLGSPRRLKTIRETNMQSAYMAGRYKAMMEAKATHPYWRYVAILDSRTRPTHRALDGVVFSIDDEFTNVGYPPNGYNCRCRAVAMSRAALKREGITPTDTSGILKTETVKAGVDKRTGEVRFAQRTGFMLQQPNGKSIWVGPDVGFNSSPIASPIMDKLLVRQAKQLTPNYLNQVQDILLSKPRMDAWRGFVKNVIDYGFTQNQSITATVVKGKALALAQKYINDQFNAVAEFQDNLIIGKKAQRHSDFNMQLTVDDFMVLPILISNAQDFRIDTEDNALIYKVVGKSGKKILMAIQDKHGKAVVSTVFYDINDNFEKYSLGDNPRYIKE